MKFAFLPYIILLQVLSVMASYGQQGMTSAEIIEVWKKTQPKQNIDSVFRGNIHLKTRATLDTLLNKGFDTLVVYSVSYPGYVVFNKDSCITTYEVNSYFFWQQNGRYHKKEVHGQCESKQSQVDGEVIRFSVQNYSKIEEECFVPSIQGIVKVGDQLRVKSHLINHEPKYSILIVLAEKYKSLNFAENDLIDKESMFMNYNRKLTSFRLFELINKRTEKVE